MDSVQGKKTLLLQRSPNFRILGGSEFSLSLPQQFHDCTYPDKAFVVSFSITYLHKLILPKHGGKKI
jgi:hypothetical protein